MITSIFHLNKVKHILAGFQSYQVLADFLSMMRKFLHERKKEKEARKETDKHIST